MVACHDVAMPASRILIVEDDPRIAASVRRALTYDGYRVTTAASGPEGLSELRRTAPDLVVLDLMLPEVDGLEICRRIRESGDPVLILMLTARTAIAERVAGLDAGADDYLTKPFAHDELLARVRTLLRRSPPIDDRETLAFADVSMDAGTMEVERRGKTVELTALEFRLLEYFLRNPRRVLSRSQILQSVWGLDTDTTSNIVDVYVRYLRQKLELHGGSRLIQTVRGAGYSLREAS